MKKFAAVVAFAAVCVSTSAFAGGEKHYAPAPAYGPAYGPAPVAACAPACAPACGPSFNPFEIVGGVVTGVGSAIGAVGQGIASIFSCNPCY